MFISKHGWQQLAKSWFVIAIVILALGMLALRMCELFSDHKLFVALITRRRKKIYIECLIFAYHCAAKNFER